MNKERTKAKESLVRMKENDTLVILVLFELEEVPVIDCSFWYLSNCTGTTYSPYFPSWPNGR
jgi:hypothetical protein